MTDTAKRQIQDELTRLYGIEKAARDLFKKEYTDGSFSSIRFDMDMVTELKDALAVTKKVKGKCKL